MSNNEKKVLPDEKNTIKKVNNKQRRRKKKNNVVKKELLKVEPQEQAVEVVFGEPSFSDKSYGKDGSMGTGEFSGLTGDDIPDKKLGVGESPREGKDLERELEYENPIEIIAFEADTVYLDDEKPTLVNLDVAKKEQDKIKKVEEKPDLFNMYDDHVLSEAIMYDEEFDQNTSYFGTQKMDEKAGNDIIIDHRDDIKRDYLSRISKADSITNEEIDNKISIKKEQISIKKESNIRPNQFVSPVVKDIDSNELNLPIKKIEKVSSTSKDYYNLDNSTRVRSGFKDTLTGMIDFKSMTNNFSVNTIREKSSDIIGKSSIYAKVTGLITGIAIFTSLLVAFNLLTGIISSSKGQLFLIIVAAVSMFGAFLTSAFGMGSKSKSEILLKISLITSFSVITIATVYITTILFLAM